MQSTSTSFSHFEDLVESLLNHTEEEIPSDDSDIEGDENSPVVTPSVMTPQDEVRQMQEAKICKICRSRDIAVVFLPCGHLASCLECSSTTNRCPICKTMPSDKVRVYTA